MRASLLLVLAMSAMARADSSASVGFVPGDAGSTAQALQLELVWQATDEEIAQVRTWSATSVADVYQGASVTCAIRDTNLVCDALFDHKGKASAPDRLIVDDSVEHSPDFGGASLEAPTWKKGGWSVSVSGEGAILLGGWVGGAKKPMARCKLTTDRTSIQDATCSFKISKTGKLSAK